MKFTKFMYNSALKILAISILLMSFNVLEILAAPSVATISAYSGSVYVKKSGGEKKVSAFKGMRLVKGDTIFTNNNSSVTLDVDGDKELKLGSNTQLSITQLSKELDKSSKSEFRLWTGQAWANITKKLDKNSRYEIRTSTTIAGVRGTKFYVCQDEDATEIVVLDGTVVAETFVVSKNPDGTYDFKKVENPIEKNEQFIVQDSVQSEDEISVKPVELKTLDLFVLNSFRESIADSNPELLDELDKIIDMKEKEAENNPVEEASEEKIVPEISYDPTITEPTPTDNSNIVIVPDPVPNYAPVASDVVISGLPKVGEILTGKYQYSDSENDAEGTSIFKWYKGDDISGTDKVEILGANTKEYTLTLDDLNKYIFFEVTPVAVSGTLTGEPKLFGLETPVASSDTDAPVGKLFDMYALTETKVLFVQFNEALSSETLSKTNPADVLLDSSISYGSEKILVPVKELQWISSGNMENKPLLQIILSSEIGFGIDETIIVEFKPHAIKDLSGNAVTTPIVGTCINNESGSLPITIRTDELSETMITDMDNYFDIKLGSSQGGWVSDIISDTNKLNMLYESFYAASDSHELNKLKSNFSAELLDNNTITITIAQTPDYNIAQNQLISILIPGELTTTGTSSLTMPFTIYADTATMLSPGDGYSTPEKGSTAGTTKIASLSTGVVPEATKWQIKVLDEWYYDLIYYDGTIEGAVDYVAGTDIIANPYQYLLLLATDDNGRVKAFDCITLYHDAISPVVPPIENLSFINTSTNDKQVLISNSNIPMFEWLEIITTNNGTPSDSAIAEYRLNTSGSINNQQGIHTLETQAGATTDIGDTVYYRYTNILPNGTLDTSPWIADGTISYADVPINIKGDAPGNFILSAKDSKVTIKGISGMKAAVIKNGIMSTPVSIDTTDNVDIYIEGGITPYDEIVIAILNDSGNICSRTVEYSITIPNAMHNDAYYNGFSVMGHLNSIKINNTYDYFTGYFVNVYKNGVLVSSNTEILSSLETIIPIDGGLSAGDKIQVQVIDSKGNESSLSEEVIVLAAPDSSNVILNYGTSSENDTITINNLKPDEYYRLDILPVSGNNPSYDYLGATTNAAGTLGPINFEMSITPQTIGTTGSTCEIYLIDDTGNTSLKSELITAI